MRISDWSSDVCSSDLKAKDPPRFRAALKIPEASPASVFATEATVAWFRNIMDRIMPTHRIRWLSMNTAPPDSAVRLMRTKQLAAKIGRAACRERGCKYV